MVRKRNVPLSNTKLEEIAVHAVNTEALKYNLLADIPVRDKGISFDGKIEVFKDESETVESLLGQVPVQVKGTFVNSFSEGNRTFPVNFTHLRNYYNSNGVLYFVIEINKKRETKIFFKQLLPTEIRHILNAYKAQKKRIIELRPLSETYLYRVCKLFLEESKRQAPHILENNPFEIDQFTSYQFTSLTYDPSNSETSNIYEHDFTIYGLYKSFSVPLGIARVTSESNEILETVVINGEQISVNIEITRKPGEITLLFEKSIELIVDEKGKFNFKINKFVSVATQLKVLPILLSILTGEKLHFIEQNVIIQGGNVNEKKWINRIKNLHSQFLELQKVYSLLMINDELKFITEENLINDIYALTKVILEKDLSKVNINKEYPGFYGFKIGGIYLILFYEGPEKNSLINGFSKDILEKDYRIEIDGELYSYSPFIKLNEQGLAFSENINFEVIIENFNQINPLMNDQVFKATNHFCLMCLRAYDLSKKRELLMLANNIYEQYESGLNAESEKILLINQLQIKIRLNGSLSETEKDELILLKQTCIENYNFQFCANVLLGNKSDSDWFLKKLDQDTKNEIKDYPIYSLYQNLSNGLTIQSEELV